MSSTDTQTSQGDCTYLPRDPTTGCLKPRSCRECLLKKGCIIGTDGICESDNLYQVAQDYSKATALNGSNSSALSTPQKWQFPQVSAKYCPTSDATCKKCIDDKFNLPATGNANSSSDSRFCLGTDGCVCVANCEISAIDWPACPAPSSPSSSSSSSSASRDVGATITVAPPVAKEDSCRYSSVDPATGCKIARKCDECLRTPGCRIARSDGFCEEDSYSDLPTPWGFDFHRAFTYNVTLPVTSSTNTTALANEQDWIFPAFQAKYCPTSDPTCQECTNQNFWLSAGKPLDNRFCVGASDCICIASCAQSETYKSCGPPQSGGENTVSSMDGLERSLITLFSVIGVSIVVGMAIFFYCARKCHKRHLQRKQAEQEAAAIAAAAATPVATQAGQEAYVQVHSA